MIYFFSAKKKSRKIENSDLLKYRGIGPEKDDQISFEKKVRKKDFYIRIFAYVCA